MIVHSVYALNTNYPENHFISQNTNDASTGEQISNSFAEHLQAHMQHNVSGTYRYAESQVSGVSSLYWGLIPTLRHQPKSVPTRTSEDLAT